MAELLFEIGTEELPSWYVLQAKKAIADLLGEHLAEVKLPYQNITSYATPRRIAVVVKKLAEKNLERIEKRRGPAVGVAFDETGKPTKAAIGFARSSGVEPSDLKLEEVDKGEYVFAHIKQGGKSAKDLLPPVLKKIVENLPAPRKMRWGTVETPFLRPITWLTALLDSEVLPVKVAGLSAKNVSFGHRFLAPLAINITEPNDYIKKLEEAYVIAEVVTRQEKTWQVIQKVCNEDLLPVYDEDLLDEVASLIEYPFAVLGEFDKSYLKLPEEVLITTMIHHQRYFPIRDSEGKLAPYFVAISNNKVLDEVPLRKGYEKVLNGRLYDAYFFWETDQKKSLSQHAWKLSGIGFHKDLGSMADKVSRVSESVLNLAKLISLDKKDKEILEAALPIFRSDLGTQVVYELPKLEGTMARAYALVEGQPLEVAEVLEQGIRPTTPGGPLPSSTVGALLAVSDRLDTLVGFFAMGKRPSGSADPFGLRRAAIALARIVSSQGWLVKIDSLLAEAVQSYASSKVEVGSTVEEELREFIWDRVTGLLAEEGINITLVRAAVADNPPIILAVQRSHLLKALSGEEDFENLLILYKRAANLAKEAEDETKVDAKHFDTEYEPALLAALKDAEGALEQLMNQATQTLSTWDLGQGPETQLKGLDNNISTLLNLKAPLDDFLDNVLVKVDNEKVRNNRLALLREARDSLRALGALECLEKS